MKAQAIKTASEIKKEILEEAKGHDFVVVKDYGEIWGSCADYKAIKSSGGILCIIQTTEVKKNYIRLRNDWYWGDSYFVSLDELCIMIEKALEKLN